MTKKKTGFLKIRALEGSGGTSTYHQKNFFQKVKTRQDGSLLGQFFFSKAYILGFEKFLVDP